MPSNAIIHCRAVYLIVYNEKKHKFNVNSKPLTLLRIVLCICICIYIYLRWVRNTDQHIFWSRCHMLGTSVLDEGIWTIHSWRYSIKPNKKNNHKHLLIIIVRRPFPYLRIVEDSKCCAKEWLIANRILTRCDQLYQRVGDFILLMSTRSCLQVLKGFWIFVNLTFIHYPPIIWDGHIIGQQLKL